MCCQDAPAPPDLKPQAEATMEVAELSRQTALDQLAFAQEKWASQEALLEQVLAVQVPAMQNQYQNALDDRTRYEGVFQPLEDRLVEEALDYDTQARREKEAGEAMADVGTAFDAQRENAQRQLESYGIDPSQTRAQAIDADVRIAEAAQKAGAANMARRRVENTARGLRAEAINIGRGMPGQSLAAYSGSTGTGTQALNNANSTYAAGLNAYNPAVFNPAMSGYSSSANITNQGYQSQLDAFNSSFGLPDLIMGGMGVGAGYLAGRAEGGPAEGYADGGVVDIDRSRPPIALPPPERVTPDGPTMGPGGPKGDAIPARLSSGEFVVPAETVLWKGQEFFEKTIRKSAEDRQTVAQERAAKQGVPVVGSQSATGIPQQGR